MTNQPSTAPPLPVLVVDDEVPLARVVASYMQREGFAAALGHDARRRWPPRRSTSRPWWCST